MHVHKSYFLSSLYAQQLAVDISVDWTQFELRNDVMKIAGSQFTALSPSRPSPVLIADVGQIQRPAGNREPVRAIQDTASQKENLHPHL
jgi:hypothetical protein